jgi:glycopeptide antibiotics resistance protein
MDTTRAARLDGSTHPSIARDDGRPGTLPGLFAVYLLLVAWTVLWKLHVPYIGGDWMRAIKLVPFVSGGGFGASAPAEVAANLFLFIPFGLYLGMLAGSWSVWKSVATMAAASLTLEVVQYLLALGSSDITDVIVNTAGGIGGMAILAIVRRTLGSRTGPVIARVCMIGTTLFLVAAGIYIASFPTLPAPRGVVIVDGVTVHP